MQSYSLETVNSEGFFWRERILFLAISVQGVVHKLRLQEGVGGQKKPNLVNIVCECPLIVLW